MPESPLKLVLLKMAVQNTRVNARLLAACAQLPLADQQRDSGGFFGSVIGHWNHIMFADLIFLNRLAANAVHPGLAEQMGAFPVPVDVDDVYHSDLTALMDARQRLDRIILDVVAGLDGDDLDKMLCYRSTEGQQINAILSEFLTHLFLHDIHHRGQITTLLAQFGIEYGPLDMPVIVPESGAELYQALSHGKLPQTAVTSIEAV